MLAAVEPQHRTLFKVAKAKGAQFDVALTAQHGLRLCLMSRRNEGHRRLHWQAHTPRALIGGQPELHAGSCRSVAPMPGQDKALL
ncbi:hypothetical protein D3C77_730260 [compost metagenome]